VRKVGNVSGTTVTLDTTYDTSPTDGLVATDLVGFETTAGASVATTTVASVTNGTVFEATSGTGIAIGDLCYLRPQTATYTLKEPFKWSRSNWRFAADATTAASATPFNVEAGSEWTLTHAVLPDAGANRSGSFDPLTMPRGQSGASVKVKMFLDNNALLNEFNFVGNQKYALVINHLSDNATVGDEELRLTFNNLHTVGQSTPLKTGELIFEDVDFSAQYDTTDTQQFDVKVINDVASI
jgi:hypothetical protein